MEYSITRMITLLARKSQGCMGEILVKYQLTVAEQPFFMALQNNEGITQERLTLMVGVDKAATARAVKSLEQKGFLTRRVDERDRRNNLLYATEKAKELYPAVKKDLLALNGLITAGIDEEEQKKIYRYLQIMEQNFIRINEEKNM